MVLHTILYILGCITHSIPLDEGVMQHTALAFFQVWHLPSDAVGTTPRVATHLYS